MNTTIGYWTETTKKIKEDLVSFIFKSDYKLIGQEASLPFAKSYV